MCYCFFFPIGIIVVSYQVITQSSLVLFQLLLSIAASVIFIKWNFAHVLRWFSICLQDKTGTSLCISTRSFHDLSDLSLETLFKSLPLVILNYWVPKHTEVSRTSLLLLHMVLCLPGTPSWPFLPLLCLTTTFPLRLNWGFIAFSLTQVYFCIPRVCFLTWCHVYTVWLKNAFNWIIK